MPVDMTESPSLSDVQETVNNEKPAEPESGEALYEEINDFIDRQVLEKDVVMFEG